MRELIRWLLGLRVLATLTLAFVLAPPVRAQDPSLPAGALTDWIIREPEEIVAWLAVDVRDVSAELPAGARFVTIGDLARHGVGWAAAHLQKQPTHGSWGVSFFEVIRAATFSIDGATPDWPANGAAAIWAARIEHEQAGPPPAGDSQFVLLDFWIPDSTYARTVRTKGHYAEYARVTLHRHDERWVGVVAAADLDVEASCVPDPAAAVTDGSGGRHTFYPPANSSVTELIRVAFVGHRIHDCATDVAWRFSGPHPLARTVMIAPPSFQAGYVLRGGAYHR